MNGFRIGRIISLIMLITALLGCTTTVEISVSEISDIDALSENFRPISTQQIADASRQGSSNSQGGFYLVELKSKVDLEKLVRQREMAFLYYELRLCGNAKKSSELYSAPAFVDAQTASLQEDSFYYYAPVPRYYQGAIDRYRAMSGEKNIAVPSKVCIGLGAGNMAGQNLKTNFAPIELGEADGTAGTEPPRFFGDAFVCVIPPVADLPVTHDKSWDTH